MGLSVTDRILFLRLISDICPNSPELEICSTFREEDYIIMKPHDVILNYVVDEKTVGIAIISGKGGSGKTYGIGYYLYYKHFNKGYNKNNTVIYSVLTRDNNRVKLEIRRTRVKILEKSVYNIRDFFVYLTGLKGDYNLPLIVHLVIDNVNNVEDLLSLVSAYRETVRFFNNRPLLKLYILTRIGTRKIAENLRKIRLDGPHPITPNNSYMRENVSLCKFYVDKDDKYKVAVCKMRYDAISYYDFMSDLLDKLTEGKSSYLHKYSEVLDYLHVMSYILPALITERIRSIVLTTNWANRDEVVNEILNIILDYPYTIALYNAYIPRYAKLPNLGILSKRVLNLFLRKYLKDGTRKPVIAVVNRSWRVPLDFVMEGNNVYSVAYVQSLKDVEHVLRLTTWFLNDLKKDPLGRRGFNPAIVMFFPKRLRWIEKGLKELGRQGLKLKVVGVPITRKEIHFLVNGIFHYS